MPYRAHVAPLTPHLRLISTSRTVDLAGANEDSSGHAEFFHANRAWRKTVESDGTEGEDFHEHLRRWRRRQRSRRPQRATAQQKRERWRTPAERAARGSLRCRKTSLRVLRNERSAAQSFQPGCWVVSLRTQTVFQLQVREDPTTHAADRHDSESVCHFDLVFCPSVLTNAKESTDDFTLSIVLTMVLRQTEDGV